MKWSDRLKWIYLLLTSSYLSENKNFHVELLSWWKREEGKK